MKVYIVQHAGQFSIGTLGVFTDKAEAFTVGKKYSAYGADFRVTEVELDQVAKGKWITE